MKLRTFIAVEINEEIRKGLSDLITRLKTTGADVKWVAPENIHITLKFLGYIEDSQVVLVSQLIREATTSINSFTTVIKHLGAFPNVKRPRVIFVVAHEEGNNLATIYSRLNESLTKLDIESESREFTPHLTVGRVKSLKNLTALTDLMDSLKESSFGQQMVKGIVLMQSDLKPTGPVYKKLEEFKFG
ncbi:MAG: RNA 2',3'-cyclic phosphodiesterase [Planctomycetes bacterium]|nr:RNA 2',3'-cyclic phosphodiesterase [Planctomycetota bacterium]